MKRLKKKISPYSSLRCVDVSHTQTLLSCLCRSWAWSSPWQCSVRLWKWRPSTPNHWPSAQLDSFRHGEIDSSSSSFLSSSSTSSSTDSFSHCLPSLWLRSQLFFSSNHEQAQCRCNNTWWLLWFAWCWKLTSVNLYYIKKSNHFFSSVLVLNYFMVCMCLKK